MNILQKIDSLRVQRNWTFYKLAEEAGVTSSTLFNMYKRKSNPSISTLVSLCKAFGITVSEFFNEKEVSADAEELELLKRFRLLSTESKNALSSLIKNLNQ